MGEQHGEVEVKEDVVIKFFFFKFQLDQKSNLGTQK
jgi:hypothetical protein